MSVLDRFVSKLRRDDLGAPVRATCMRCRREYTREPEMGNENDYCWWCAARVRQVELFVVRE